MQILSPSSRAELMKIKFWSIYVHYLVIRWKSVQIRVDAIYVDVISLAKRYTYCTIGDHWEEVGRGDTQ